MRSFSLQTTLLLLSLLIQLDAFGVSTRHSALIPAHLYSRQSRVILRAGGFGGGGAGKKTKKKEKKLKPKQQWDRYTDMLKKATKVEVALRVAGSGDDAAAEWLSVGCVKSKDNKYTKIAVVRQRALIADHARRLYPLKVTSKDVLEWGYKEGGDTEEWTLVDKSILDDDDVPANVEKMIGFEGKPDPASGYYCVYNEGRLVNDGTAETKPSYSKLNK